MTWQGLMIVVGYTVVIAVAWPWGLLAVAAHVAVLLLCVPRK